MNIPPARPLHFWLSFIALVVGMMMNGIFGYLNYIERRDMRAEARMSRSMLNARARIQVKMFTALSEGRPLTQAEITEVNRLWIEAEYQYIDGK